MTYNLLPYYEKRAIRNQAHETKLARAEELIAAIEQRNKQIAANLDQADQNIREMMESPNQEYSPAFDSE